MSLTHETREAIGYRIQKERREACITQNALALLTHLPIGRIEMGLEHISDSQLVTIAQVLHCKVAHLLPESEGQE